MKQVCIIHGGTTYDSDKDFRADLNKLELDYSRLLYRPRWNNWLGETLTDHEVLLPSFPNSSNAKYSEWSIYFSKILPFLRSDAILIGHSLGGIFLAKYLTEHADSMHFEKVILIAAPYNKEDSESLGSFRLPADMSRLASTADNFYLFHSHDDDVVSVHELEKYHAIIPNAKVNLFDDRRHFNTPTFTELIDIIKE